MGTPKKLPPIDSFFCAALQNIWVLCDQGLQVNLVLLKQAQEIST